MGDLKSGLSDRPVGLFVLIAAVVVSLVITAAGFVSGNSRAAELREVRDANEAQIEDLRAELSRLEGPTASDEAPEPGKRDVKSPISAGAAVAAYQNQYYDARVQTDPATRARLIELSREQLKTNLEPGAAEMAAEWFTCENVSARFTWEFKSRYECVGETMECLWTCVDRNQLVVAFAVGTYHADSNKFSDISVHMTRYGSGTYQGAGGMTTIYDDEPASEPGGSDVVTNPPAGTETPSPGGGASSSGGDASVDESTWASQMEEQFLAEQEKNKS